MPEHAAMARHTVNVSNAVLIKSFVMASSIFFVFELCCHRQPMKDLQVFQILNVNWVTVGQVNQRHRSNIAYIRPVFTPFPRSQTAPLLSPPFSAIHPPTSTTQPGAERKVWLAR